MLIVAKSANPKSENAMLMLRSLTPTNNLPSTNGQTKPYITIPYPLPVSHTMQHPPPPKNLLRRPPHPLPQSSRALHPFLPDQKRDASLIIDLDEGYAVLGEVREVVVEEGVGCGGWGEVPCAVTGGEVGDVAVFVSDAGVVFPIDRVGLAGVFRDERRIRCDPLPESK